MFLESITVVETTPCHAETGTFKVMTKTSCDLTTILPYLNRVVERATYNPEARSLVFPYPTGNIGFTLRDDQITIIKYHTMTEAFELIDWVQNLINDTYDKRGEITPKTKATKVMGVLKIYGMLPKTNCKKCGAPTCMAFANKVNVQQANILDCPELQDAKYADNLKNVRHALGMA